MLQENHDYSMIALKSFQGLRPLFFTFYQKKSIQNL